MHVAQYAQLHALTSSCGDKCKWPRTLKCYTIAHSGCCILLQWTWVATLLQSSLEVFSYGVSGSLWYAIGGTIQILLFGVMAIEIKRKAPRAHTVLELVRKRWGHTANWVRGPPALSDDPWTPVSLWPALALVS